MPDRSSRDRDLHLGVLKAISERFAFAHFAVGAELGKELGLFHADVMLRCGNELSDRERP